MNRIFRNTIFYLLIFLVIIGVVSFFNGNNQPTKQLTYTELINHLDAGDVAEITQQPERGVLEIRGKLKGYKENETFVSYVTNNETNAQVILKAATEGSKIDVKPAQETSGWITFFTSIIPFVIIFILFFFLLNQAQGGGGGRVMNFGRVKQNCTMKKRKRFALMM